METIIVRFTCALCDLRDVEVAVPVREPEEDIRHWVETTLGNALQAEHNRRRPFCPSRRAKDVKIPIDGRPNIGGPLAH